jgi:hypothetical protein
MRHGGKWRGSCASTNRDIYRSCLHRFVRLIFVLFHLVPRLFLRHRKWCDTQSAIINDVLIMTRSAISALNGSGIVAKGSKRSRPSIAPLLICLKFASPIFRSLTWTPATVRSYSKPDANASAGIPRLTRKWTYLLFISFLPNVKDEP